MIFGLRAVPRDVDGDRAAQFTVLFFTLPSKDWTLGMFPPKSGRNLSFFLLCTPRELLVLLKGMWPEAIRG